MFSNFVQNTEIIDSAYPIIKDTIPLSSRGYNTNNKYPEFPPLMSDGRTITASWQPEAVLNADLIQSNNIKSNWEYRKYLINNAKEIREYNFRDACNDAGYYKRPIDLPSIQSNIVDGQLTNPYKYNSFLDNTQPFGYSSSDLKDIYLSREQLEARKIAPAITQYDLLASSRM
jgi:hypothetical protein